MAKYITAPLRNVSLIRVKAYQAIALPQEKAATGRLKLKIWKEESEAIFFL